MSCSKWSHFHQAIQQTAKNSSQKSQGLFRPGHEISSILYITTSLWFLSSYSGYRPNQSSITLSASCTRKSLSWVHQAAMHGSSVWWLDKASYVRKVIIESPQITPIWQSRIWQQVEWGASLWTNQGIDWSVQDAEDSSVGSSGRWISISLA